MIATWWKADDVISCDRCQGRCHDAVDQRGRKTLLVCNYCGLGEWAYGAPEAPRDESPRMASGRYAGMTLTEISKQDGGLRYLEWIRDNQPELREAVLRCLAASQ